MRTEEIFNKLADYEPSILGEEKFKKYSILIPLIEIHGETNLLFEVRAMSLRSQPGDVCFPGGRIEQQDKSQLHCALRETEEELGIEREAIQKIVPLDYIVSDFGRIIYPFVGEIDNLEGLRLNNNEVAEVFTVPLSYFLEQEPAIYKIDFKIVPEENFPFHLIQGGKNYNWRLRQLDEFFYEYNGYIIWGLTARIIKHFVDLLQALNK